MKRILLYLLLFGVTVLFSYFFTPAPGSAPAAIGEGRTIAQSQSELPTLSSSDIEVNYDLRFQEEYPSKNPDFIAFQESLEMMERLADLMETDVGRRSLSSGADLSEKSFLKRTALPESLARQVRKIFHEYREAVFAQFEERLLGLHGLLHESEGKRALSETATAAEGKQAITQFLEGQTLDVAQRAKIRYEEVYKGFYREPYVGDKYELDHTSNPFESAHFVGEIEEILGQDHPGLKEYLSELDRTNRESAATRKLHELEEGSLLDASQRERAFEVFFFQPDLPTEEWENASLIER